ncbi:disulfide bond formation protein B [Neisseriaceae bacterium ESL0693]|nr:disulfide bond formation protein B [Neisseriaceae bacterium ESL0693]
MALWVVAGLSVLCFGGSFFAQYVLGLNPCVLCIAERVLVILTGLIALVAALCPNRLLLERSANAILISLAALAGFGVSLYQIYIQHLPLWKQPSCGAPWTFRLRQAPLFDWYEPIIRGTGNCGQVQRLLGVPLPVWSALFFAFIVVWVWGWWWKTRAHKNK